MVRISGTYTLGTYQLAMSVFAPLFALSSSGIPLVVSRKTAALNLSVDKNLSDQTATGGAAIGLMLAVISTVLVTFLAEPISRYVGNESVAFLLRLMLPTLFVSALYSASRGSLWGKKQFTLYGVNETAEEFFTLAAFLVFGSLLPSGATALGLTFITSFSLAALLSIIFYFKTGGKIRFSASVTKKVFSETAPITAMRLVSSLATFLILFLLPKKLAASGLSIEDATSLIGLASGVVLPLVFIPSTFVSSLNIVSVPENAADFRHKRYGKICERFFSAAFFSFSLSLLIIPLYALFGSEITHLIFGIDAGAYLALSSPAIFFIGLSSITSSLLNACEREKRAFLNSSISFAASVLVVMLLTEKIGIYAYVLSLTLQPFLSFILNAFSLAKTLCQKKPYFLFPLKYLLPIFCALLTGAVFKMFFVFLSDAFILLTAGLMTTLFSLFMLYVVYDFSPLSFIRSQKRLQKNGKRVYN